MLLAACCPGCRCSFFPPPTLPNDTEYSGTHPPPHPSRRRQQGDDALRALEEFLGHAEAAGALPPLVIVQALSRNPALKVSLVRGLVARGAQRDLEAAARDRGDAERLAAEAAAMAAEVERLRARPHVFQNSRCAAPRARVARKGCFFPVKAGRPSFARGDPNDN